jgi:hypothetical protein
MRPTDLTNVLHARPLRPFRIVMSDGTMYEVRHPEMVIVARSTAVIGYPDPASPEVAERYDIVALAHIVRIEFIEQPAPAG